MLGLNIINIKTIKLNIINNKKWLLLLKLNVRK